MTLSRTQFFLALFTIFFGVFFLPKLLWVMNSTKTTGIVSFTGHGNLGSVLGISTYQVVMFTVRSDTFEFNSNLDLKIAPGESVEIRYQRENPSDARINNFKTIWGDTVVYSLLPLLILLAFLFLPDIIPGRAKVRLGGRAIIRIIEDHANDDSCISR